jgi:hypothetical protein
MSCTGNLPSLTKWSPASNTSVNVTSYGLTIACSEYNQSYDTFVGVGIGFAPMYIGSVQSTFCMAANISLSITYNSSSNLYAGFMLFTDKFIPMFELGIGGTMTSPQTFCTYPKYNSIQSSFISISSYEPGKIVFNDGSSSTTCTFTKNPVYAAFYMRGSNINSATFTNITCNGLIAATIPNPIIQYGLQLPGLIYYGGSITNTCYASDINQCKIICNSEINSHGFMYDSYNNLCSIIQDIDITNFKVGATSNVFIKDIPNISDIFVSVDNTSSTISPVMINGLNISVIAIDNYNNNNDAVMITDSNVYICQNFYYSPVSINNKCVLCIQLSVNNSNIYIQSLNNYDFKRITLLDTNFNPISCKFINQHFKFDTTISGVYNLAHSTSYSNFQQFYTYPQYYFNYGGAGNQFEFVYPLRGSNIQDLVGLSPCKINTTSDTRFMCINQNILILLNGQESFFNNSNIKGCLFFNDKSKIYTETVNGTPPINLPRPSTSFKTYVPCSGVSTIIHLKYNPVIYRNFINRDTFTFYQNGTYSMNNSFNGTYNSKNYTLINLKGNNCLAQIQSSVYPPNVTGLYANYEDIIGSDDDYSEYPLFVTYNTPPVTLEFIPISIPINYISP